MVEEDKQVKDELLAQLQERSQKVKEMGGAASVERQKKRGKLTARERIDQLLDKGTFREIALFAKSRNAAPGTEIPSDAVVTGYGEIDDIPGKNKQAIEEEAWKTAIEYFKAFRAVGSASKLAAKF